MASFPLRHSPAKSFPLILALSAVALCSCTASPSAAPPSSSAPAPSASAAESTTPAGPSAAPSPDAGSRPLGWGPEQRDQDAAAAAVAAMSPEEKAGQVLLPFFKGNQVEAHAALIQRLHLAGSIIMGDNVPRDPQGNVDIAAMGAVTQRLQQAVAAGGRRWPGIIGVDQEGGAVARLGQ